MKNDVRSSPWMTVFKLALLATAIFLNLCAALLAGDHLIEKVFGISGALWGMFLLLRELEDVFAGRLSRKDEKLLAGVAERKGWLVVGGVAMMPCPRTGTCYSCDEARHCKHCCNWTLRIPVE